MHVHLEENNQISAKTNEVDQKKGNEESITGPGLTNIWIICNPYIEQMYWTYIN